MGTKESVILIFSVIFFPALYAEPFHYQNILQGESAAGMGGAFTGLADDSSACFYNPAGITKISTSTFSLSATAGELSNYIIKDLVPGGKNLKSVTATFYPTSWSIIKKISKHGIGFSVIVRDNSDQNLNLRETIQLNNLSDEMSLIYDVKIMSREYLIGPSYAYPVTENLSLGVSAFVFYKTSYTSNFFYAESVNSGEYFGFSSFNNEKSTGLSLYLGALYKITQHINIGINFRSGGAFSDTVKTSEVQYENTFAEGEHNKVIPGVENKYRYGEPPGVTVGIGYDIDKWRFGFDYTHIFKIKPLNQVDNINIGVQRIFLNVFPVRFGYYTNNTSLPSHKVDNTPEPDRFNIYGITFGMGYISEHTSTSLTFIVRGGNGQHKEIVGDHPEFYDVSTGGVIVNLGGSYWF